MSKPVARIVLSALITVAILVGIYMTVYGAAFSVGASSGRMQVTAGLLPALHHTRTQQIATVDGYYTGLTEQKSTAGRGHHCDEMSSSDE